MIDRSSTSLKCVFLLFFSIYSYSCQKEERYRKKHSSFFMFYKMSTLFYNIISHPNLKPTKLLPTSFYMEKLPFFLVFFRNPIGYMVKPPTFLPTQAMPLPLSPTSRPSAPATPAQRQPSHSSGEETRCACAWGSDR